MYFLSIMAGPFLEDPGDEMELPKTSGDYFDTLTRRRPLSFFFFLLHSLLHICMTLPIHTCALTSEHILKAAHGFLWIESFFRTSCAIHTMLLCAESSERIFHSDYTDENTISYFIYSLLSTNSRWCFAIWISHVCLLKSFSSFIFTSCKLQVTATTFGDIRSFCLSLQKPVVFTSMATLSKP